VRHVGSLGVGGVGGTQAYTGIAFIGLNDLLVLGKDNGVVTRMINGMDAGPVLDLNVTSNGLNDERGLLGIAVHLNFASNKFVYLYYTKSNTSGDSLSNPLDNRVERYFWNGSALVNPTLIISLPANHENDNGGKILFGPDGKLYIVIGDLDRNGQLQNNSGGAAPDNTGVIFRLNDDGSTPGDNPFVGQGPTLARYYAYGIRNSFGMAFDPLTGRLWMTENGPSSYDEINLVQPGFNSGWNKLTGPDSRDPQGVGDLVSFTGSHYADPKFSWFSSVAPTGLAFVNSLQLGPNHKDHLFVGDFNNGTIYRFKLNTDRDGFMFSGAGLADLVADNNTELQELVWAQGFDAIVDMKVGPDGKLYVLALFGSVTAIERNLIVDCSTQSLQAVIDDALPGDVITIIGECTENILIRNEKQRLTITRGFSFGQINASDSTRPAMLIRGKGILVQNLAIQGGNVGVHVNRGSNAVLDSIFVGGSSTIDGILVDQLSFAVISNSTISGNSGTAIIISENSTARIGFNSDSDTGTSPNTLDFNTTAIIVRNQSSARIVGNQIRQNNQNGIMVFGDSHADIAGNLIEFNTNDGIVVFENSAVRLGEDSGSGLFDLPNDSTVENTGFGIRCLSGGAVTGRLGTLNGLLGATDFAGTCATNLNP
jgi:glucose/arabinose dehydrogenase